MKGGRRMKEGGKRETLVLSTVPFSVVGIIGKKVALDSIHILLQAQDLLLGIQGKVSNLHLRLARGIVHNTKSTDGLGRWHARDGQKGQEHKSEDHLLGDCHPQLLSAGNVGTKLLAYLHSTKKS
ncbi:hypothetical protein GOP47_0018231 [Adiantum capillus-veneris]|uniref:Uncharacterized protein n=1 Tax=Adiantum capillus-veneris TaxID=13818 RepID=A0A9D4Z9Y2_ADICA|nr:hypothetical protein GOP47_0018231 [Adiantum capillus-veneris]